MQDHNLLALGEVAAAALAAHRLVNFTSTGLNYPTANGTADGVTQYAIASGEYGTAVTLGTAKIEAEEAITKGAEIEVGTDGKAAAKTVGGIAVGKALEAASADGDIIEVLLFVQNRVVDTDT